MRPSVTIVCTRRRTYVKYGPIRADIRRLPVVPITEWLLKQYTASGKDLEYRLTAHCTVVFLSLLLIQVAFDGRKSGDGVLGGSSYVIPTLRYLGDTVRCLSFVFPLGQGTDDFLIFIITFFHFTHSHVCLSKWQDWGNNRIKFLADADGDFSLYTRLYVLLELGIYTHVLSYVIVKNVQNLHRVYKFIMNICYFYLYLGL